MSRKIAPPRLYHRTMQTGADPSPIRMHFEGAGCPHVNAEATSYSRPAAKTSASIGPLPMSLIHAVTEKWNNYETCLFDSDPRRRRIRAAGHHECPHTECGEQRTSGNTGWLHWTRIHLHPLWHGIGSGDARIHCLPSAKHSGRHIGFRNRERH